MLVLWMEIQGCLVVLEQFQVLINLSSRISSFTCVSNYTTCGMAEDFGR